MAQLRRSFTAARILIVFLRTPDDELYGQQIIDATGLRSGALYPMLDTIEKAGWIEETRREQGAHPQLKLKPKVFYRLTSEGKRKAPGFVDELRALLAP